MSQMSKVADVEENHPHHRRDVLIHNAGYMMFGPAEVLAVDQFAEKYDVNVLGTQRVNRVVLPYTRHQKQGLLV